MSNLDAPREPSSPELSADRARTLVLRCWFERGDSGQFYLRGTLRDLARGRATPFEGLPGLLVQLQLAIGEEPASQQSG